MLRWLAVSAGIVVADQVSKWVVTTHLEYREEVVVLPMFSWVRWHNDGAAFSMFAGGSGMQRWFFVALAIGFSVFIIYELRRLAQSSTQSSIELLAAAGYALIMGGAIGNMIDRLQFGYVVDFIAVHYERWYFPAFNIADASLFVGACLWLYASWREYRLEKANA